MNTTNVNATYKEQSAMGGNEY